MIVEASSIMMSTEHEKSESIELTRSFSSADISGFVEQFKQARSELFSSQLMVAGGAQNNTVNQANNQGSQSPLLEMTDEGLQFKPTNSAEDDYYAQQALTLSKLWESLLKAINPDYAAFLQPMEYKLQNTQNYQNPTPTGSKPMQMQPVALQVSMKFSETIEEYECSNFHSCGIVKTADGKELDFSLSLNMERSFKTTREFEATQEVVFKDPLVVNFAGNAAELSDDKYEFDIDADGENDLLSYLISDSGMLALDKNDDGIINDGSELFGALSGNGFSDLSAYDEDGNQFIDEADSVFTDLGIWSKTADSESLIPLAEKGIGAIYLGSSDTPFELKGEDNQANGRVISSGVYLTESGEAGTLQQIDMVV